MAWIAERKDVLSGLFFALTLLAWSYYARRKSVTRYLLAVLAAALGTLSKPMLVTIPFALVATVSAVATVLAQHGQIDTFGFSLPLRFENAIVSYAIYLRQLIWPVDLVVLCPHPENSSPS